MCWHMGRNINTRAQGEVLWQSGVVLFRSGNEAPSSKNSPQRWRSRSVLENLQKKIARRQFSRFEASWKIPSCRLFPDPSEPLPSRRGGPRTPAANKGASGGKAPRDFTRGKYFFWNRTIKSKKVTYLSLKKWWRREIRFIRLASFPKH